MYVYIYTTTCFYNTFIHFFFFPFLSENFRRRHSRRSQSGATCFANLSRMFTIENAIYILGPLLISISLLSPELCMCLDLTFSANMEQLLRTYSELHIEHSHLVLHFCNGHIYIKHPMKSNDSLFY